MNKLLFGNNGTGAARYLAMFLSIIMLLCSAYNAYSHPVEAPQSQSQRTVTGVVTDSQGEPLVGAAVTFVGSTGTTVGAITDLDGNFQLTGPKSAFKVEVTCLGFSNKVVEISASRNNYTIVMTQDAEFLDEVVVVAFGQQKKETVTGAISMVQTKDLVQSPQANVSNMLAGRMPGLLAVQRSGEPGEDFSTLRIRGVGTFASGEGSQEPLVMVDGIETTNFNNIDPNEIESLSILKDASSTAVYGVRGANGVILITTKRGAEGKPQISYSGNFAITQFTDLRETMNAYEYATSFNQARMYDSYISGGYTPRFTDEQVAAYKATTFGEEGADPVFYPNVNWYDMMLRDHAFTTQHNVNVSGGADKVKYFISAGYYNQEGLFNQTSLLEDYDVQSAYERFNFRTNLDFNVTKNLSIKINLASQMETRTGNAGETGRLMDAMARANPISTPGVVDGKIVNLSGGSTGNPMTQLYQNGYRNDYRNNLNGSVGVNYKIPGVEGLSVSAKFSYENYYQHVQKFTKNPPMTYNVRRNDAGELVFMPLTTEKPFSASESYGKNRRTYIEAGINYSRRFADAHNVTALLLYNQSTRVNPSLALKVPNKYQGIVGRVTYDYRNRYLFEVNVGYNGTENFAPGKRFGLFPAYSLGWVLTEEPFWPKNDVLNFFKVRGSYGEVGNDRIGGERFLYLPTSYVTQGGQYHFGHVNSGYNTYGVVGEGKIGNPELTWERAKKTNVGVEMTFWKSRLRITGDWFIENRDNILANRNTTPAIFGGDAPAANIGKMTNTGYDLEATFADTVGEFSYWIKGNYTYARNTIEFMDEVPSPYPYTQKTGQSLNQYFGLICDGIYNSWDEINDPKRPQSSWNNDKIQPGDLIYRDVNGDGIIDNYDMVPIGYSNFPEVVYGFSIGGNWRGLDFSVLFQGADHVSLNYSRLYTRGFFEDFSAPKALLNSWSQERYEKGLPIEYPRLSEGDVSNKHNYQSSTFWIRDASYLRLKNVEIGYTFPKKWLKKVKMSSARIFINGNNLYTWSDMIKGVDPEAAQQATNYESYPITKVYNIGLTIKF